MINEKIEERVTEYKNRYEGILNPEIIEGGANWYRQALQEVASQVLDEFVAYARKALTNGGVGQGMEAGEAELMDMMLTQMMPDMVDALAEQFKKEKELIDEHK